VRLFTDSTAISKSSLQLSKEDYIHFSKALRLQKGDALSIVVDEHSCWETEFLYFEDQLMHFKRLSVQEIEKPILDITLVQGLVKQDKMDTILDTCTQVGAADFIPISMQRSIVKWDDKKRQKQEQRWRSILRSAAMQSQRHNIPELRKIQSFTAFLDSFDASNYDYCLVAWEEAQASAHIKSLLHGRLKNAAKLCVVIGPEGGIDASEISALSAKGFDVVSLGKSILRAEWAALVALSQVNYESISA